MRDFFMNTISNDLTNHGWRVVHFEFPYMEPRVLTGRRLLPDKMQVLLETYRSVVEAVSMNCQQPLLIGGKSMGGRIDSILADSLYLDHLIQGAVCLGYPFHPLRKPEQLRTGHLKSLRTPMLIVQGERDPMGGLKEVPNYEPLSKFRFAGFLMAITASLQENVPFFRTIKISITLFAVLTPSWPMSAVVEYLRFHLTL